MIIIVLCRCYRRRYCCSAGVVAVAVAVAGSVDVIAAAVVVVAVVGVALGSDVVFADDGADVDA